jgi:hypothetical protein
MGELSSGSQPGMVPDCSNAGSNPVSSTYLGDEAMAADLHIHVFAEGEVDEEVFQDFFCGTIGSKYFDMEKNMNRDRSIDSYAVISALPSVWVGSVSWLKAALFEDSDTFVPDAVGSVAEIIEEGEEFVVIDDELIGKVAEALKQDNRTGYYEVAKQEEVISFLEGHRGKRAFTVSW